MLVAIANGCYCGGGFKGVPKAILDDGLIDVSIIDNISRRKFIALLGKYKEGTHLEDPATADIVSYKKCKSLVIKMQDKMKLCTDGEITMEVRQNLRSFQRVLNFLFHRVANS